MKICNVMSIYGGKMSQPNLAILKNRAMCMEGKRREYFSTKIELLLFLFFQFFFASWIKNCTIWSWANLNDFSIQSADSPTGATKYTGLEEQANDGLKKVRPIKLVSFTLFFARTHY